MNSEKSSNFNQRLENLKSYFLYSLYSNICRSLFEKDKLVFSMLLLVRLLEFNKQLNPEHWRFLLTGGMALSDYLPEKPKSSEWLSLKSWGEITRLSEQKNFEDLYKKC
jgi:dynein heavy chain